MSTANPNKIINLRSHAKYGPTELQPKRREGEIWRFYERFSPENKHNMRGATRYHAADSNKKTVQGPVADDAPLLTRAGLAEIGKNLTTGPDKDHKKWSWREESNPRPADYKSAALPTELRQPCSERDRL